MFHVQDKPIVVLREILVEVFASGFKHVTRLI
jgi:hypothetical protein